MEVGGVALLVELLELPPPPHAASAIISTAVAIPAPNLPVRPAVAVTCIQGALSSWWGFTDWVGDCRHGKGGAGGARWLLRAALGVDLATPLSVVHVRPRDRKLCAPALQRVCRFR